MDDLDKAAHALVAAKAVEARATAERIKAENILLDLVEQKAEGSLTVRGAMYKATVTFGISRAVDAAALESVRSSIPPAFFERAITYKPSVVMEGLRYLQNSEPDIYNVLAQAITAKPYKPSVKVEPIQIAAAA